METCKICGSQNKKQKWGVFPQKCKYDFSDVLKEDFIELLRLLKRKYPRYILEYIQMHGFKMPK